MVQVVYVRTPPVVRDILQTLPCGHCSSTVRRTGLFPDIIEVLVWNAGAAG